MATAPLTAPENRRVGRAMQDYSMLANGDRVLIAVSGGLDSLVLAWLLYAWQAKAPISYELQAVHVDMLPAGDGAGERACRVAELLASLGISCLILPAALPAPASVAAAEISTRDVCFRCARSRRRQLFEYSRLHNFTSIALGHHLDDIVETFFLNLTCAGNISTMRPRQDLFSGRLGLIRPLAYLRKDEITAIAGRLDLHPVPSSCPLSEKTRRGEIREMLELIYARIPGSREHIVAALGNVRSEYLLIPAEKTHANKS